MQILSTMISQAVNEKAKTEDLLVNEIYQHISFCQNKCKDFYGREDTLKVYIFKAKLVLFLVIFEDDKSGYFHRGDKSFRMLERTKSPQNQNK